MNDYSKRRIDLYALISSLELDLREFILTNNISIDFYDKKINGRLSDSNNNVYDKFDKKHRIMFLDFGEYCSLINTFLSPNSSIYKGLLSSLFEILQIRNRVMHTRPLKDGDYDTVLNFAQQCKKYSNLFSFENLLKCYDSIKNNPLFSIAEQSNAQIYVEPKIENNLPVVDYDDTGFVGREAKKKELRKKINSAHPIISVVGNGGIGKTSMVLSCIYDYIDEETFPFEKVLWVTLKTKSLQNGEFRELKNSIKSFGECIEHNQILSKEAVTTIDHLLFYMSFYKTLLVLDNLETINVEEVKELFEEIPKGSKIIITSRIGIREYESRLMLDSFDLNEAINYFRRLVKTYSIKRLNKIPDEEVIKYVKKLYCSPLCIKWFAINVAKGNSPDIVVDNQDELVEFCLSNVFDRLSENAKNLLKIILLKRTSCHLSELIFLNNNNYLDTLESVQELCACNFLEVNSNGMYDIPEFALKYLPTKFDFKSEDFIIIQQRINVLIGLIDNMQGDAMKKNITPTSLSPKTQFDKISTIYMQSFIESSEENNFDDMEKYFDLAQKCSPRFADIYKVAGYYYARIKNNSKANDCYKNAIQYCSDDELPYMQSFYSLYLTNNTTDFDEALSLIEKALTIYPDNPYFLANKARTLKFTKRFNESLSLIDRILNIGNLDFALNNSLISERVDIEARRMDLLVDEDEKMNVFLENVKFIDSISYDFYNAYLYKAILKTFRYTCMISSKDKIKTVLTSFVKKYYLYMLLVSEKSLKEDLGLINQYLDKQIDLATTELYFPKKEEGKIVGFHQDRGFGFIKMKGRVDSIFFHFSKVRFDTTLLKDGLTVLFVPVLFESKFQAREIELLTYDESDD